jgi:tetratricopeptide (TPR) repeat protein
MSVFLKSETRPTCINLYIALVIAAFSVNSVLPASAHQSVLQQASTDFKQGRKYFEAQDFDRAIDYFLQATYAARNNYYPDAYFYLGLSYKAKHQDQKAIEALDKAVQQAIGPAPEAHLELGKIYMRDNQDQQAEQEFNQALAGAFNEYGPEAQNYLGLLAEKRGDVVQAQDCFMAALGEKPWKYTKAWMNYAELMVKQQDWGDALISFQEMLDRGSSLKDLNKPRIYLNMGLCLFAKGDHQGALEQWHQACALKPDWATPHLLLGDMFEKESHISSAITEYRDYLRLAPNNDKNISAVKDRLTVLEQDLRSRDSDSHKSYKQGEHTISPYNSLAPEPDGGF